MTINTVKLFTQPVQISSSRADTRLLKDLVLQHGNALLRESFSQLTMWRVLNDVQNSSPGKELSKTLYQRGRDL